MASNLSRNENLVKTLEKDWHVIRHGEKIQWLKTAYREAFFAKCY